MRRLLTIALNDLRLLFVDKSIWVNLLIVPVVLSLVLGVAFGGFGGGGDAAESPVYLDVIDADQTDASQALLQEIVAVQPRIVLCGVGGAPDEGCALGEESLTHALAQNRLEEEESMAFLEIPAGFGATMQSGARAQVVYRTREGLTEPSLLQAALSTAVQRAGGAMKAQHVANALVADLPWVVFDDEADRAGFLSDVGTSAQMRLAAGAVVVEATSAAAVESDVPEGYAQSMPGMASMYALFTVLPMAAAFIRDRKQWTIQRALTMPVARWQLMGGKLLAYFLMGLIQISIVLGFGYLMGLRFGSNPLALLTTMIIYTLAVTGLALLVTALVRTEAQAASATLLVALTMAPLGGAWWPLDIVPRWMQTVGYLTPISWAMEAYRNLIYRDAGFAGIALPMVVLLGMAVLFFAIGVWRVKVE